MQLKGLKGDDGGGGSGCPVLTVRCMTSMKVVLKIFMLKGKLEPIRFRNVS